MHFNSFNQGAVPQLTHLSPLFGFHEQANLCITETNCAFSLSTRIQERAEQRIPLPRDYLRKYTVSHPNLDQ